MRTHAALAVVVLASTWACGGGDAKPMQPAQTPTGPYVLVLGTAQDAGLPQIGSDSVGSKRARTDPDFARLVASLLVVDPATGQRWLIDCTPDIRKQVDIVRLHPASRNDDGPRPALFDGIFLTHADGEIPGRSMADIPHPFIQESLDRFGGLDARERNKIVFTHLNHTNPAADPNGEAAAAIGAAGMAVADDGQMLPL